MLPPIIMKQSDIETVLANIGPNNFLGKGADGTVYRFDYYNIPAVVKVPNDESKKKNLHNEIVNYSYICKVFNDCSCKQNIVQMLGYDMKNGLIMLEFFDGSDLIKYTGYPMSPVTFYTHRLIPRTSDTKFPTSADFTTLGKYLGSSDNEETILILFNKIYSGILCLHGAGIVHSDFELKNILIRTDGKIGISDFGLSRIIGKDIVNYPFSSTSAGFGTDLNSLGPMMGNFLDSTNPEPYQYRLDNQFRGLEDEQGNLLKGIDDVAILDKISNPALQDAFLILTKFKELVEFVSMMNYLNKHVDLESGSELINDAASEANDNIESEVELEQVDIFYLNDNDISSVITTMFNKLTPNTGLAELVLYFRLIFDQILILNGADEKLGKTLEDCFTGNRSACLGRESVHNYVKRVFGSNYDIVITSSVTLLRYGFLLKHFNLFNIVYQ